MKNVQLCIDHIPVVTSLDAFEDALLKFQAGGSQRQCMESLLAIGLPARAIRWLASYPGRTMSRARSVIAASGTFMLTPRKIPVAALLNQNQYCHLILNDGAETTSC